VGEIGRLSHTWWQELELLVAPAERHYTHVLKESGGEGCVAEGLVGDVKGARAGEVSFVCALLVVEEVHGDGELEEGVAKGLQPAEGQMTEGQEQRRGEGQREGAGIEERGRGAEWRGRGEGQSGGADGKRGRVQKQRRGDRVRARKREAA
jgi:hypothetical protein